MRHVLAYSHQAHDLHHHGYGLGSWVAHTVARGLIYRTIWSFTRGMGDGMLLVLVLAALIAVWLVRRA